MNCLFDTFQIAGKDLIVPIRVLKFVNRLCQPLTHLLVNYPEQNKLLSCRGGSKFGGWDDVH